MGGGVYLDEHVLLAGLEEHLVVVHVHADGDDVGEQLLVPVDGEQGALQVIADLVLGGQEHRQVLGLLQRRRVRHHAQELRRPDTNHITSHTQHHTHKYSSTNNNIIQNNYALYQLKTIFCSIFCNNNKVFIQQK